MTRIRTTEFQYSEEAQESALGSVEPQPVHTQPWDAPPMAHPRAELPAGWRWLRRGPEYAVVDRAGTRLPAATEAALLELIERYQLPSSRRADPERDEISRSLISERFR